MSCIADTDNDELYDCVDPCDGTGAKDTCPGTEASHPSYFTVSDCSTTATVTYKRAPQLKTNTCDPDDAISWVTIYWLQDGMANGSMCTKVNEIPADGEVTLVRFSISWHQSVRRYVQRVLLTHKL